MKHARFELGKAEITGRNGDIAILAYGFLFKEALKAKELISQKGYTVNIVNLRMPETFDEKTVLDAVKNSSLTVTLEDHFISGGLYSILSEIMLNHKITADVMPFATGKKCFKPLALTEIVQYEGFSGEKIADKVLSYIKES